MLLLPALFVLCALPLLAMCAEDYYKVCGFYGPANWSTAQS